MRGLFKTKTVDIMVRTFDDLKELEIKNLTAYQFTDMNQILLVWSEIHANLINWAQVSCCETSTNFTGRLLLSFTAIYRTNKD